MYRNSHIGIISFYVVSFGESVLQAWSNQTKLGMANFAPGVIFDDNNDVAPDVVWISRQRLAVSLQPDGKLHDAPELAIEVLSPGGTNEKRDREIKLKLYSRRGVEEMHSLLKKGASCL